MGPFVLEDEVASGRVWGPRACRLASQMDPTSLEDEVARHPEVRVVDAASLARLDELVDSISRSSRVPVRLAIEAPIELCLAHGRAIELALTARELEGLSLTVSDLRSLPPGLEGAPSATSLEALIVLLRRLDERASRRVTLWLPEGFSLFPAGATLEGLRVAAELLRRLGARGALGVAPPGDEPRDERVRRVLDAVLLRRGEPADAIAALDRSSRPSPASDRRPGDLADALAVLREAMDQAAGSARGKKHRPLRLAEPRLPRDEGRPLTARVALDDLDDGPRGARALPGTDLGRRRAARAIDRIRRAARDGVAELVLTARAPATEWYLVDLVRLARSLGVAEVALETAAAELAEAGLAAELAEAGLTRAHVTLRALEADGMEPTSGSSNDRSRARAGVVALLQSRVAVILVVPLLAENRGALADIVARAATALAVGDGAVLRVEARVIPGELTARDAANELLAGVKASRASAVELGSAPDGELPPCVFDDPAEVLGVLRVGEPYVSRADHHHRRIPLCASCAARSICPGPRLDLAAAVSAVGVPLRPATADAIAPLSDVRRRVLSEYRSRLFVGGPRGARERRIVRVNFHCNQACDFCFVSRELPPVEEALILREIEDAARAGAVLELSGGEPTLNPQLPRYIAHAVRHGVPEVGLQTNAIKLADPAFARELADAGLRHAFVSLHGTTPEVSDRVTSAPGTFEKTVRGIQSLLAVGVAVKLNFVLCGYNVDALPALPDFVQREFVEPFPRGAVGINFSFVAASTDNVPLDGRLIPRFSDVAWALAAADERAERLGLSLTGFDAKCGVPPCYLPEPVRARHVFAEIPEAERRSESARGFVKGPQCDACDFASRCYGVRASYAALHGTTELRPIQGGRARESPLSEARLVGTSGPFFDAGLAPSHGLHELSRERLRSWSSDRTTRAVGGEIDRQALDLEIVALAARLRRVVKRERPSRADADAVAERFRSMGYAVRVVGGPGARATALLSLTETDAALAAEVEEQLRRDGGDAVAVRAMGDLLGYPACCSEVFAGSTLQTDAAHFERLARAHASALGPEDNWAAIGLRPISHFPCRPGCGATSTLARATLDALAARDAHAARTLRRWLSSVVVLSSADRYALLLEPIADRGGEFRYQSVESALSLGLDGSVAARPPVVAFELEVIDRLRQGDRVAREGSVLRVARGESFGAEISFAREAPWLLDFSRTQGEG